jgi:ATP-dependent DNA helicase RecQ
MHPDIYAFDRELRQASEALANITEDIAEEELAAAEPESNEIVNEELFNALKKWRLERARADQVAPFIVAHNTLLEAIAKRPPTSAQQLLGLPGFGAKKLETYGEGILKVTAEFLRSQAS